MATAGPAITNRWLDGGLSVSMPPVMITAQNQMSSKKCPRLRQWATAQAMPSTASDPGPEGQQGSFRPVPDGAIGKDVKGASRAQKLLGQELGRALARDLDLSLEPARLHDAHLVNTGIPLIRVHPGVGQHWCRGNEQAQGQQPQVQAQSLHPRPSPDPGIAGIDQGQYREQPCAGVKVGGEPHDQTCSHKAPPRLPRPCLWLCPCGPRPRSRAHNASRTKRASQMLFAPRRL
jgi:hypothetical protein